MSASSSSLVCGGSVGGGVGAGAGGGDILDLDRYMRATVRPSRHRNQLYTREQLVVDAGGARLQPVDSLSSSLSELCPRTYTPTPPTPHTKQKHSKRYSHDSGLSDESYVKRRHKPHRRNSSNKYQSSRGAGGGGSSDASLREFRAACARALRDQQEQIARVADLCSKLAQPLAQPAPQAGPEHNPKQNTSKDSKLNGSVKKDFAQNVMQRISSPSSSSNSSDVTTSTRSSRAITKEKRRTDTCKTYNLIMGKLDELSRVFASRRVTVPAAPAPRRDSSRSVSVCDKMVATECARTKTSIAQVLQASRANDPARPGSMAWSRRRQARAGNLVLDESVLQQCSESASDEAPDAFDLDNPLHLYSQAKRLQALHASTRRRVSGATTPMATHTHPAPGVQYHHSGTSSHQRSSGSVCALCRAYWRALARCVHERLFAVDSVK